MSSGELLQRESLRGMQLVAGALLAGQVIFAGVVLFLVYGRDNQPLQPPADRLPIVTILAGAMILVSSSLSFVLPRILTKDSLQQLAASSGHDDVPRLLALEQRVTRSGSRQTSGSGTRLRKSGDFRYSVN